MFRIHKPCAVMSGLIRPSSQHWRRLKESGISIWQQRDDLLTQAIKIRQFGLHPRITNFLHTHTHLDLYIRRRAEETCHPSAQCPYIYIVYIYAYWPAILVGKLEAVALQRNEAGPFVLRSEDSLLRLSPAATPLLHSAHLQHRAFTVIKSNWTVETTDCKEVELENRAVKSTMIGVLMAAMCRGVLPEFSSVGSTFTPHCSR